MVRGMALTAHGVAIDRTDPKGLDGFSTEAPGYERLADLCGHFTLRTAGGGARTRTVLANSAGNELSVSGSSG